MFNLHTTSPPLLLSILAIAACLANPRGKDGYDADKLFAMAETALHHCRNESRIDILQALMVLSLRQTGCGDKRSAFAYAGRASCMALNLGLHAAPTTALSGGETELRARVYWVCVLSCASDNRMPMFSTRSWLRKLDGQFYCHIVVRRLRFRQSPRRMSWKPGRHSPQAAPLYPGMFDI